MDNLIHLGTTPLASILLAKLKDKIFICQGCNSALCKEEQVARIPMYCPRCDAVLWYFYMGSLETLTIDQIRSRELPRDKELWTELDLCQYFVIQYETVSGKEIEPSEAIYPAFGYYFDSKAFRYLEQLLHSLFVKDTVKLSHYVEAFMANMCKKPGFHWSWIGNFKIAERYLSQSVKF